MRITGTSFKPRLFAAAVASIAIATVAFLLPTAASGSDGGASTSTLRDAGVLRLQLGATDRFRYEPTPGSPTGAVNQTISAAGNCRLTLGSNSLVNFSATPSSGFAGFVSDAIGVRAGGEGNGQPCGRIDAGQTLTMNLDTGLGGKVIDFAEIDLELKFSGAVTVTGYMVQGTTATQVGSPETYHSVGSDSGPDSADGDNYRVRFPRTGTTTVNSLVFNIDGLTGAGSLEGGADGTGPCDALDGCVEPSLGQSLGNTTDSLFHLLEADGVLACGGTADLTEAGITSHILREDNVGGGCGAPIPYDQASSTETGVCNPDGASFGQCTFFRKDLLGQQAQFTWTVTWGAADESYMPHNTQFDFPDDGRGYVDAQFCLADGTNGPFDGFPDLPPQAGAPPTGPFDPWCVIFTHSDVQLNGQVVVEEQYFGQLDPSNRR